MKRTLFVDISDPYGKEIYMNLYINHEQENLEILYKFMKIAKEIDDKLRLYDDVEVTKITDLPDGTVRIDYLHDIDPYDHVVILRVEDKTGNIIMDILIPYSNVVDYTLSWDRSFWDPDNSQY